MNSHHKTFFTSLYKEKNAVVKHLTNSELSVVTILSSLTGHQTLVIPSKYTVTGSKTFAPHDLYYIATCDTSHYMEDSRLPAVRLWIFRYIDDTKTIRRWCKCWLNSISHMWSDQFTLKYSSMDVSTNSAW